MKTHGYCLTINNPTEDDWLPYMKAKDDESGYDPFGCGWRALQKDGWVSK